MEQLYRKKIHSSLGLALIACLVVACGGGGGGSNPAPPSPFVADCVAGGTNSAVVSWNPPTTDTTGTPITLAGFNIFCKTAAGGYFHWIASAGVPGTSLVINGLVSGELTFAVTAVSVNGVESELSNLESKTF